MGTQNREEQTHKIQKNVYSLLLFESIRQVIKSQLCVTVVDDEFQYIKRALQRNMGSCLLWVMSTEISVDIAVDTRSIVGRHSVDSRSTLDRQSVDSRSTLGR